jgi:hypothetical protein
LLPSFLHQPDLLTMKSRQISHLTKTPDWQRERAARLHRQFTRAHAAMARGCSLNDALRQFCNYWAGEAYRTDRSRRVQFSRSTLRRLFYHWRANGRTPAALALQFAGARVRHPAAVDLRRFMRCLAAEKSITTMRGGYLAFAKQSPASRLFKWRMMQAYLTPAMRNSARNLLHGRRQQATIEKVFRREFRQS